MIDFILKSFPDAQASPSHPLSRSFDLSAYAGVTDAAIPPGSLLAWCHALSDAFSDTQQRFARRIKDEKVCHTLLPTLNRFESVSNSPTQGKELKPNPDVLDLLRNRVPDNRHVPLSLKEAAALKRSLRSGLESHNFLTWSVIALIRSLHEKKLLPKDDPVISQLQKSFSKACGNVASCMTSSAAFVTLKRRQLLLSHVVPSVSDAQKRNLLSDPFFQTSSLFSASSVEAARSAARDLSLFKPHLKASSSMTQSRRPAYSSSSAQRGPARSSSQQSSAQRPSSPLRQQSGKKGESRFQKKSSGPHQKRAVGGCLANFWLAWRARGVDAWVVEVLRVGYRIPFDRRPPLSERPLSLPAYSPQSIKGVALTQELQTLLRKGAVEPAPQSPGFYSRLFLVQKASGSCCPIIDLSTLNDYVTSSHFHMETPQSVLRSIRPGDWMVSLDLQDAYLQVPVHHDSRRYLRFVVGGRTYQFRVLCFGLTTAPQVFTRIMAPVSAILHKYGVRMLCYLDDWLILASSEIACLQSRDRLLTICTELGIQVNLTKSSLVPTQSLVYLGMEIRSLPFIARPTPVRVSNLLRLIEEFLSTPSPPASLWRRLLGHLSSLTLLVSGGMLRMRLLQLCFKDQWDFPDDQFQILSVERIFSGGLEWHSCARE